MQQPLVSILMPTHNRVELFKIAFQSAINQTYKNIEIVISDDSDNDETYQYVQAYLHDPRIRYSWNRGFDAKQNWQWVITHCEGDYFNYLMDDDIYSPDKIEKMVEIYEQYPNVSLVTSHRQLIDISGNYLNDIAATKPIVETSSIISGDTIYYELLRANTNFIGELTTVLLRGKYRELMNSIIDLNTPLPDVIMWLEMCEKGDVVYLTDTLSYFRFHSGNAQFDSLSQLAGYSEWSKIYYTAYLKTDIDERKRIYLDMHIGAMVKLIELWIRLSNDDNLDKNKLKERTYLLDEVIHIYKNYSRGLKDWHLEPEISNFINEYE